MDQAKRLKELEKENGKLKRSISAIGMYRQFSALAATHMWDCS
jgi:hypothetical protein